MTLTIQDDNISSDRTRHTACLTPGHDHAWRVSWLPGRLMDRNSAITAMTLAEVVATDEVNPGHRLWLHIEGWSAELGLTAPTLSPGYPSHRAASAARRTPPSPEDPEAAGA